MKQSFCKKQMPGTSGWAGWRICLVLTVTLLVSACTVMNRYDYDGLVPDVKVAGKSRIAVASLDQRLYVLNREKRPRFTGLFRSGFGIPYDMTTSSGKPVADEFSAAIGRGLKHNGFTVVTVPTTHMMTTEEVSAKAVAVKPEKILLLTILEWKGETFGVTTVHFNLTLDVLNGAGTIIASKYLSGTDIVGGQLLDHLSNPLEFAKEAVPREFARKIAQLLDSPEVTMALTGKGGTGSQPAKQFM